MISTVNKRFLVLGRAGLDLYPDPVGTTIATATSFTAALGGSSGNIAAGLARLGAPVGLLTKVSDDAVGDYTLEQCRNYGIEIDAISKTTGEERTTLALSESRIDDTQTVIYRNNASDFALTVSDINSVEWGSVGALIFTGTSLAKQPSREATLVAIGKARDKGATILFDIDYRAYSWGSLKEAAVVCGQAASMCDFVIGNDDEFGVLSGSHDAGPSYAKQLVEGGKACSIYKMGSAGSVCYHQGGSFQTGIFPVEPLKPTGAGDAFMAGFSHALSTGFTLEVSVQRGSAAAAIVVTRVGCAPAMPTVSEIDQFMASHTLTSAR